MKELNILYLEDSSYDAELVGHTLRKAGIRFNFNIVDTREEFINALKEYTPDIILSDHSLFQFNSLEALQLYKKTSLKIPFILVTGTVSEEFAVKILKEGADDYLLKNNLARLPSALINCIEKYRHAREKQQYLENIIANESLMKAAEKLAKFGSWQYNKNNDAMQWSHGAFQILGYLPGEVKPDHAIILSHIYPNDRQQYKNGIIFQHEQQSDFSAELRLNNKAGLLKYVFFQSMGTFDNKGKLVSQLGFMQDVTNTRLLERKLAKQALARQKLITETTILAQESERKFLGRELHDNINQILAGSKIYLQIAANSSDEDKRTEFLNKGFEQINEAVSEIRHLSKSLVAPTLGDIGLVHSLRELADEINIEKKVQIKVVDEEIDDENMEDAFALMFYRIAQEQLNNIRKYSNASEAVITLKADKDCYKFSIADNGVGFDAAKRSKGLGLLNIKSRVDFYEGEMNIITSPGKGCNINISIPKMRRPDNAESE